MENLPSELIQAVFLHLPPLAALAVVPKVCRRWRDITGPAQFPISVKIRFIRAGTEHAGGGDSKMMLFPRFIAHSAGHVKDPHTKPHDKTHVVAGHITVRIELFHPTDETRSTALLERIHKSTTQALGALSSRVVPLVTSVACTGDVIALNTASQHRALASTILQLAPTTLETDAAFADLLFASGCDHLPISSLLQDELSDSHPDSSKPVHPLRLCPFVSALHLRGSFAPPLLRTAIEADAAVEEATNTITELRYDPVLQRSDARSCFCPLVILNASTRPVFTNLHTFGTPWLNILIGPGGMVCPHFKGGMRIFPTVRICHFRVELEDDVAKGAPSLARYLAASFCALNEVRLHVQSALAERGSPYAPDTKRHANSLAKFLLRFRARRVVVVWKSGSESESGSAEPGGGKAKDRVGDFLDTMREVLVASGSIDKVWCGRVRDIGGGDWGEETPWEVLGR